MARERKIHLAQAFRKDPPPAEALLWKALRNRALGGYKFRRQHPIGPYIVDFACVECKLIVEVDGVSHLSAQASDETRNEFLAAEGWLILRFWNTEVYEELESVREAIFQMCEQRTKG